MEGKQPDESGEPKRTELSASEDPPVDHKVESQDRKFYEAETNARMDGDDDPLNQPAPGGQTSGPEEASIGDEAFEENPATPKARISALKIAVSTLLIGAVLSGFFIFENKSQLTAIKKEAPKSAQTRPLSSGAQPKEIGDGQASAPPSIYESQLKAVSALRDALSKKQAEVLALKQSYQNSIVELEKEILDEQQRADIDTFLQASRNKAIALRLKTIQRRQAYIRQLQHPCEWVSKACERLLYIKRRTLMDLQVSAVASGIDMDQHTRQIQAALQKYQPTADKLAIDPKRAQLESLETIWEHVQKKKRPVSSQQAYSKNQIISGEICAGNFRHLSELSEISVQTAKCIVRTQASDLFLNQITEISASAARHLCQWKGSWICLNGIKALSPRAAHYLFQWDGNWISLNGLIEFPPEIGAALLNWEGKQLELMGLEYAGADHGRIAIEYLTQWEQIGGKLFVPPNLREKINALHRQSS